MEAVVSAFAFPVIQDACFRRSRMVRLYSLPRTEKPKTRICVSVASDGVLSNTAQQKMWAVSTKLQKVVGQAEIHRHLAIKRVWEYAREHELQDPKDKRNIVCDDTLREVFGVKVLTAGQIMKLLSDHLIFSGDVKPKSKKGAAVEMSDELRSFLKSEECLIPRHEVVKRIWAYAKEHNLQDPKDKRIVKCDAKLKSLLKCDSFQGISVVKYLSPHFITK